MQDPYSAPNQHPSNPQQPMMQPMAPRNDGFAITSMVCGIVAVLTCYFGIILGTIAVIFGHISVSKINKDPNLGGKGMAIAGLVCGYIGIAITLCTVIFFMVAGKQIFEEVEREQKRMEERQNRIDVEAIPDAE